MILSMVLICANDPPPGGFFVVPQLGSFNNWQGWRDSTPLWPAGHLPRKEGDWMSRRLSPITDVWKAGAKAEAADVSPCSPLAGETSGRTEEQGRELDLSS